MEDRSTMGPIDRVFALVEKVYPEAWKCLVSIFGREVSRFILESVVSKVLAEVNSSISDKKIKDLFKRTLNLEIHRILMSRRGVSVPLPLKTGELPDGCNLLISKQNVKSIYSKAEKGFHEESAIKKHEVSEPDISFDFDAFKTSMVEKQMNIETGFIVRRRKKRIILALLVPVLAFLFLCAVFLSSFKPLISGDITYGIAVKRFFAGFPMIKRIEDREPTYLTWKDYETKEQLLKDNPGAFILIPTILPEGYAATKYIYMTHSNGYTTAVVFSITDFASFTIEYAVRDDYDPLSYRILFYDHEIVREEDVSFYLFKESNYGFTAAFFLDDIYVVIKGQRNYKGTNNTDLIRLISGMKQEYYGTVTD
ncbi:MAG TPA: hypothetical protein P5315_08440 [Clostridia bacterium]|nr:hypothetical protein [Clostridia bacterium]